MLRKAPMKVDRNELPSPLDLKAMRAEVDSLIRRLSDVEAIQSAVLPHDPAETRLVYEIIQSRRRRDAFFGAEIFGEPAWDILLELYLAEQQQRRITVSAACQASASPPTTGLRWIGQLEAKGLVSREPDRFDGRRVWVSLTKSASASMHDYFKQLVVKAN